MKKSIIIPTVALFVICLVSTVLLALANNVTSPMIAEIAQKSEIESRQKVLTNATEFKDAENGDIKFAIGYDASGNAIGMVFTTTSKSYGGDLQVMTGISMDGKVAGVEILQINDTAGLGMKAKNDDFRTQFIGRIKDIIVQKNSSDPDKNEITALTGATITSKAVTTAVNEALSNFEKVTLEYSKDGGAF